MKPGKSPKRIRQGSSNPRSPTSSSRLERMISEAIVDCYNESEQATGLFTLVEENLRLPFSTIVLGIQVNVQKVELNDVGEIVAVCSRGPEKQRIPLVDLSLPSPRPEGQSGLKRIVRWARGR